VPFFVTGALMLVGAIVAVTLIDPTRRVLPANAPAGVAAAIEPVSSAR
jgi:hypothetical protein